MQPKRVPMYRLPSDYVHDVWCHDLPLKTNVTAARDAHMYLADLLDVS